jgi:hypothetical protein
MTNRILIASLALLLSVAACATGISNEERLDRATEHSSAAKSKVAEELLRLRCDDLNTELARARDDAKPEEARLKVYLDLYERVRSRTAKFDEALSRNPDLTYQEGTQAIAALHDGCVQAQADVRFDFEGLVREVAVLPVVDEFRGGSTVKVPRLSFDLLRAAIDKLELDDREALVLKLSIAEKSIESKEKRRREK